MKRPKGQGPKLTAEEIRALQAKRVEYLALDRAGRTAFLVRDLNESLEQERYFTGGETDGEERALDVDLVKRIVRGVSFASDEPYKRWYGWEILDHTPGAANFKRLNNGGAYVKEHWGEQLGVVVKKSAKFDGNKSRCDIFFSERPDAVWELKDIADGIRCNTSFRYTVDDIRWEGTADDGDDIYRVLKWTPIHVAGVTDPADYTVGFGKALESSDQSSEPPADAGGPATRGAGDEIRSVPPSPNNPSEQSETAPVIETGAVRSAKKRRLKRQVRKPMALRKLKKKKDEVECKATDAACENEDCRVHYEDDDDEPERGAEVTNYGALFRAIAKAAALGPVEEKRFLRIASDRALEDEPDEHAFRKALREDRKKHANDNQPEEEEPEAIGARMSGDGPVDVSLRAVGKLRNFKTEKEAVRYGKFLAAGVFGFRRAKEWCKDHGLALQRAQSESDNESGSIWVPQEFDSVTLDLRERVGIVRQFARVNQMASATKLVRRVKGGMKAKPIGAVGVTRKVQEQKKTWNSFELIARQWGIITKIEDELTEDSLIGMADEIIGEQSRGFAEAEDDAFVNADGTSAFHGILGIGAAFKKLHATIANIAGLVVASGNLYSEIVMGDFTKLVALLPQYADNERAAFYCSRAFFYGVMVPLMLAAGGVTAGEIQNMRQKVFLGYPVHIFQTMPKVTDNNQVCCYFGDLYAAVDFGDRRGITVRQTEANDTDFEEGLISIKSTARFDIVPHDVGNASATAGLRVPGPLVALITAAA